MLWVIVRDIEYFSGAKNMIPKIGNQLLHWICRERVEHENEQIFIRKRVINYIIFYNLNVTAFYSFIYEAIYIRLTNMTEARGEFDPDYLLEWIVGGCKQHSSFSRPNIYEYKILYRFIYSRNTMFKYGNWRWDIIFSEISVF